MSTMHFRSRVGSLLGRGVVLAILLLPAALHAQAPWSAADELARFDRELREEGRAGTGNFRVRFILTTSGIPPARRDSVVDGLTQFALTSDHATVRHAATAMLAEAGGRNQEHPVPGVAARLASIYDQSSDITVRFSILQRVDLLNDQGSAVSFLKRVAVRPEKKPEVYFDEPDEPTRALVALARMGLPGRAALRELDRQGAVRSQIGRAFLSRIAPRDYSIEPGP